MSSVGITEFKAHFSDYLRRVLEGEVFYITNRGVEVAEFRPSDPTRTILWEMVDDGELAWSGEKPKLPERMPANTGKPIADIVLEHRGPQWPEADDETE